MVPAELSAFKDVPRGEDILPEGGLENISRATRLILPTKCISEYVWRGILQASLYWSSNTRHAHSGKGGELHSCVAPIFETRHCWLENEYHSSMRSAWWTLSFVLLPYGIISAKIENGRTTLRHLCTCIPVLGVLAQPSNGFWQYKQICCAYWRMGTKNLRICLVAQGSGQLTLKKFVYYKT